MEFRHRTAVEGFYRYSLCNSTILSSLLFMLLPPVGRRSEAVILRAVAAPVLRTLRRASLCSSEARQLVAAAHMSVPLGTL